MHFDLAVVMDGTKTLEELLAPFDEDTKDKAFLVFEPDDSAREDDADRYDRDPATGKLGYWQNPNSQWDWWFLCEKGSVARFKRRFAPTGFVKPGDFARLTAIERWKWSRYWTVHVVEGKPLEDHPFYKPDDFVRYYETRENFVETKCHKICWAFLENGVFHRSPIHRFPKYAKAWKEYEREWKEMIERNKGREGVALAIVDCHV